MKKSPKFFFSFVAAVSMLALVAMGAESAEKVDFPKKRIEIVVPYPPGGISDLTARALASVLPEFLSEPAIVVNRAGGAKLEGGEYVARRKPDGYTIGIYPPSVGWPEVHFKDPPYQSTDLVPICKVIAIWQTFIVPTDSKYKSLKDVVDELKSNPSLKLQIGNTGLGANPHLVGVAFAESIGKKDQMVSVPFRGDAGLVTALLGKHIPLGVATCTGIMAQFQAGTIRVLAISGEKRWSKLPNVPTFEELGYKIDVPDGENTLYAPKGTPREIIRVLEQAVGKAVQHKSFMSIADKAGIPIDFEGHDEYLKTYEKKKAALGRFNKDLGLLK